MNTQLKKKVLAREFCIRKNMKYPVNTIEKLGEVNPSDFQMEMMSDFSIINLKEKAVNFF